MEKYNHFYNILQITSLSNLDNLQSKQVNRLNRCSKTPLRDLTDRTGDRCLYIPCCSWVAETLPPFTGSPNFHQTDVEFSCCEDTHRVMLI